MFSVIASKHLKFSIKTKMGLHQNTNISTLRHLLTQCKLQLAHAWILSLTTRLHIDY